jgi:hypothetical protein
VELRGRLDRDGLATLIDLLMAPSPAAHVGIVLREYRRRGWEFEPAWAQALRTLPRSAPEIEEWRDQLHGTKETWRESYYERAGEPQIDPLALA